MKKEELIIIVRKGEELVVIVRKELIVKVEVIEIGRIKMKGKGKNQEKEKNFINLVIVK